MILIHLALLIIWAYLFFNAAYFLLFSLAGRAKRLPIPEPANPSKKFAVYIACYKGDEVIKYTGPKALEQLYPKELFDVYVIADSLQAETIGELKKHALNIVEVEFEQSTKAKSLKAAVAQTNGIYDYAIILDIDNVMEPEFLQKLNNHLQDDKLILQAHRVALNTDSNFALLDAISEEVNNHIFRYGHRVLGLSAAFIGSGKAIQFDFYKEFIHDIEAVGGFDKEMELKLLAQQKTIHYANDALVYDEKVQEASRFEKQRKRWLSAQFHYFRLHIIPAFIQLITKGNVDYLDKAIQMVLAPRIIQLGATTLFMVVALITDLYPGRDNWFMLWAMTAVAILFSIPRQYWSKRTLLAIMSLPKAFWLMVKNLFQLKGANKTFIHTDHSASAHQKHNP